VAYPRGESAEGAIPLPEISGNLKLLCSQLNNIR